MQLADEHFRLLVESVQDYAIYLLDPGGVVSSWNAGAERLKGYRADEVIGRHLSTFFSPEDRAAGKVEHLLAIARADGRVEDIGWRFRKDGTAFWASAVITTLYDRGGVHIGFAKVTRDLTERGYRAFIEAAHTIIWTTDAEGRANADSPSWREHTGQTEAEWRSPVHAWDPVHPDDRPQMEVVWIAARAAGTPLELEFRVRRHDGVYVWMSARSIPFRNRDGIVREWFGVMFDITARKHAEAERERAFELLTTTLRSIGDAVVATDPEGRVTFMNVVAERLTGWSFAEAAGHELHDVFPIFNEDTGATVENPVAKVIREGATVGLANHTILRRRDGTELPIDDSAAPIRGASGVLEGVVLVFRDVSEEKRELTRRLFLAGATEEIVAAHDYHDALRRIVQLAVPRMADWATVEIVDPATGQLQQLALAHVDPAKIEFARELNERYPPDRDAATGAAEVVRTGKSLLYADIPTELLEAGARDAEHLRIIRELQLRSALVVPLQGRRSVFGTLTFIFAGSPRRYTAQDVELAEELGRRAALLIERRLVEEEAEAANRMKDEFLATISHELRTPLQAILGYSTMLERGSIADPAKAVSAIVRNAHAQARLVEDMLDMSRILSGKLRLTMDRVNLPTAVRAAIEAIRPAAAARGIRIVEHVAADVGPVHGDSDRLQQIVWNLLSNAVKFSSRDGQIEVAVARADDRVEIGVVDTGHGIPPEHLASIFERFRQVDSSSTRAHSGLGLGLAIVKYLVEAHGGTVRADSPGLGHGATFTVALPAPADTHATPSGGQPALVPPSSALQGIRILVVDDDDDTRESIADALDAFGADVAQASSAAEAFDAVRRAPPQVLLSDIGMPGEDGYALLRRIRALPAHEGGSVPAVAITAFARPDDISKAKAAGFQLHLAKPIAFEPLVDAIRACIATSR